MSASTICRCASMWSSFSNFLFNAASISLILAPCLHSTFKFRLFCNWFSWCTLNRIIQVFRRAFSICGHTWYLILINIRIFTKIYTSTIWYCGHKSVRVPHKTLELSWLYIIAIKKYIFYHPLNNPSTPGRGDIREYHISSIAKLFGRGKFSFFSSFIYC